MGLWILSQVGSLYQHINWEGDDHYMRTLSLGLATVNQLVSMKMWVLVLALVGYGSNDNRLRVWETVHGWFDIMIINIFIRDYLQYINFLSLSDKESVIVSSVFPVHTSWKKGEIRTAPFLTRRPSSLVPWHILYWLNGWGRQTAFCVDWRDDCTKK